MAQAYRYPLTRVCLRSGTMTLPLAMRQLFPEHGAITAIDIGTGKEYALELTGPRVLAGLAELYAAHGLVANDELHVTPLGGDRFAFEVVSRAKRAATDGVALAAILDELASAGVPVTEAEVHALFPSLPVGFDVSPYLGADPRFELRNGRWQAAALDELIEDLGVEEPARPSAAVHAQAADLVGVAGHEAGARAAHDGPGVRASAGHDEGAPARASDQPPLWDAEQGAALWRGFTASAERGSAGPAHLEAGGAGLGAQVAASEGDTTRRVLERRTPASAAAPEEERALDDSSLRALELANRLRAVMEPLGYRIVPHGGGQATLVADLGRRNYQVHVQLLPAGDRLDWASLLARRRASSARYLAVFGDHRDLVRLTNPAELARATLWSWEGLERLRVLNGTVPLSPIDLESHFERDGLFEAGLKRFEQCVAARVAERGATSEVLTRLAELRAPSVFLLEELAADAGMSRESVLRILERLAEAPFHLVARVDQGEFLLRTPVADGLKNLVAYASSLRERLPERKPERLVGLGVATEQGEEAADYDDAVEGDMGDPLEA